MSDWRQPCVRDYIGELEFQLNKTTKRLQTCDHTYKISQEDEDNLIVKGELAKVAMQDP